MIFNFHFMVITYIQAELNLLIYSFTTLLTLIYIYTKITFIRTELFVLLRQQYLSAQFLILYF